jgi:predicted nucleic acid-binding protein
MATPPTSSLAYIVIDASFAIAHCAREPSRYAKTKAYLEFHAQNGSEFFAPGVLVSESLFVFCKKLESGSLTATEHANAVKSFEVLMSAISPAPNGEASLIVRSVLPMVAPAQQTASTWPWQKQ